MPLPTPTLPTDRLRLRPFDETDADALFALHSNGRVMRYWDAPVWAEHGRAAQFIGRCRDMAEQGTGARLAVERTSDGAFLGWLSLSRWNPEYRSASLGYCLGDAAWGHGYATEAGRALLAWAFATLELNRVQAETDTRNVASARVLEKLGFRREGTLREDCVVNGEVSDSWVYGLLRREWQPSPGEGVGADLLGQGTRRSKELKGNPRRKPPEPSADRSAVDAWIASLMPGLQPVVAALDDSIRTTIRGLHYAVKYRRAFYGLPELGWIIELAPYDVSVNIVFLAGAAFDAPPRLGTGSSRYVKVSAVDEVQRPELRGWIEQAGRTAGWK